jgi:dCTP deaminase
MIVNGKSLLHANPIKGMSSGKNRYLGVSDGLAEAGYDIRLAQDVTFINDAYGARTEVIDDEGNQETFAGHFVLASAIEEFQMPNNLVGEVKDKSTWARQGLSVFNTVIEPGWYGFLTLELVYHGFSGLKIQAGQGIAQVLFKLLTDDAKYSGKYQHQEAGPIAARFET